MDHLRSRAISPTTPAPLAPIPPYGGTLVDLVVDPRRASEMKAASQGLAAVTLDDRGICDLELLAVGGFSPLSGYLGRADYQRVIAEMRLADGTPWPVPIVLPVTPGEGVEEGKPLALRDVYGNLLAFLHVEEIYPAGEDTEPFGVHDAIGEVPPHVDDPNRPAPYHAAGRLEVVRTPPHYDFVDLRRSPRQVRRRFHELGWTRVAAYHTRGMIHRPEEESIRRAAERLGAGLMIHPLVGAAKPGDVDHYARIRAYRPLLESDDAPVLGLLPLAARRGGPRSVLLQAIVARNYGCTHLILAPGSTPPPAASAEEIGVGFIQAKAMVYLPDEARYEASDAVAEGDRTESFSEPELRDHLERGLALPSWFARPEVAEILAESHPPRSRQGLTVWFTGLSGSGKSTVALALIERLAEYGRNCSFLDGDEIRTHLSKGLGFSKEDRDVNIRRVGYVAGLIARHGGTTLCSVISPYKAVRDEARAASNGRFVEVYCSTPVEVCESRDVKGLYARARAAVDAGKPMGFTGVDDAYEAPDAAEVVLDTSRLDVSECVDLIVAKLLELGYIRSVTSST